MYTQLSRVVGSVDLLCTSTICLSDHVDYGIVKKLELAFATVLVGNT